MSNTDQRRALERAFAKNFSNVAIGLDATSPPLGELQGHGWLIQYAFGCDEHGDYLDVYASHRMTNDRHVRLRPSGSVDQLPALSTLMAVLEPSGDREQTEDAFYARNRAIAGSLIAKGFHRFTVNMLLALGTMSTDREVGS